MRYSQFSKTLSGNATESIRSYGHLIQKTEDGLITIDRQQTEFKSLEEARKYIKSKHISETLEKQITKESYEDINENRIANIIREHHDIKVTDTLIESYIELASSKIFTVDPVVYQIRKYNKLDVVVEGKLHYVLNDQSIVAIDESTQEQLNNLLRENKEVVDFMRESKINFLKVIETIKE